MKKIFTLVILLAASVMTAFAYETVLSNETKTFGNDWSTAGFIQLTASQFANAKAGDVLKIHVTAFTEGGVILCQKGDWNNFDTSLTHEFTTGETMPADIEFTMTQDILDAITSTKGFIVKGLNYTCDKIYLTNDDPEPTTDEIDLTQEMNGWSASYDTSTKTITYTSTSESWGGCGWWYGDDSEGGTASKDCSAYTKVTIEFASPAPTNGGITIQYVSGDAGWTSFDANATSVEATFDATRSDHVKAIYIQLGPADPDVLVLSKAYFTKATSAINDVHATANANVADGKIYNLAGQQVDANAKGILIINGKKVLK